MLAKRINYIRQIHNDNDIKWESKPQINEHCIVWYTEILPKYKAYDYLERIKKNECKRNQDAFYLAESDSENEYRVGAYLESDRTSLFLDVDLALRLQKIAAFLNKVHDPEGNKGWSVHPSINSVVFVGPSVIPSNEKYTDWYGRRVARALIGDYGGKAEFGRLAKKIGFTDQIIEEFIKSIKKETSSEETLYILNEKFLPTLLMLEKNLEDIYKTFDQAVTAAALSSLPSEIGRYIGTFLKGGHRLVETCKAARKAAQEAMNPDNNSLLRL